MDEITLKEPNNNSNNKRDKITIDTKPFKSNMDKKMVYDSIRLQNILRHSSKSTINSILNNGHLVKYKKGSIITSQNDNGDKVFFILRGTVEVYINDRKIAERNAKECVGEMSVIDPTQKRCATLKAFDDVDLFSLPFNYMSKILEENKDIIRNCAIELCSRLRERSKYYKCPNKKPKIFIGSSKEGVNLVRAIKERIKFADVITWEKDTFRPSESTIVDLEKQTQNCDFAILVFTPDDTIIHRHKKYSTPRDNVTFELGLFMGAIGRDRTYILIEHNLPKLKLPTDLNGITYLTYKTFNKKVYLKEFINILKDEIIHKGVK